MLPIWVRVDLGAMAMKGYSVIPKAPALLEPPHQICFVRYPGHLLGGEFNPSVEEAVGVFYRLSRLGNAKPLSQPSITWYNIMEIIVIYWYWTVNSFNIELVWLSIVSARDSRPMP